jgi:hypothetical protein
LFLRYRLGARNRKPLSKIDGIAQVPNGLVPVLYLRNRRGRKHPTGESFLAHSSPGGRDELEQTAGPEEIEVSRVRVNGWSESFAGITGPSPSLFHPGEPMFVIADAPFGYSFSVQNPVVHKEQKQKCDEW